MLKNVFFMILIIILNCNKNKRLLSEKIKVVDNPVNKEEKHNEGEKVKINKTKNESDGRSGHLV